jgi:hypothetical protein
MNMDPYYLGMLVMVGTKATNKSKFKRPLAAIKECYYAKFRGKEVELTSRSRWAEWLYS